MDYIGIEKVRKDSNDTLTHVFTNRGIMSISEVVAEINNGVSVYTMVNGLPSSPVKIYTNRGRDYLRTKRDKPTDNNLDNLPLF